MVVIKVEVAWVLLMALVKPKVTTTMKEEIQISEETSVEAIDTTEDVVVHEVAEEETSNRTEVATTRTTSTGRTILTTTTVVEECREATTRTCNNQEVCRVSQVSQVSQVNSRLLSNRWVRCQISRWVNHLSNNSK